jgi:hypothetical protein
MTKERERRSNGLPIVLLLFVVAILLAAAIPVAAGGNQRPIEDFLESQGDYCIDDGMGGCFLFVPPVANFFGWTDPALGISAAMDYAGLANECVGGAFGTEISGSITERPLADGRAEVHVRLHTKNAYTFVTDGFDFVNDDLLFGERLSVNAPSCDMLPELTNPALGSAFFQMVFTNTAPGAPLPDIVQLVLAPEEGQEIRSLKFRGQASGLIPDEAGGTPGRVEVTQTGLLVFKKPPNENAATADGFPAEKIILRAVGQ